MSFMCWTRNLDVSGISLVVPYSLFALPMDKFDLCLLFDKGREVSHIQVSENFTRNTDCS